jgi:hypothetical protein
MSGLNILIIGGSGFVSGTLAEIGSGPLQEVSGPSRTV